MRTGKWLTLPFNGRPNKVMYVTPSKDLAATDVSKLVLTLTQRIIEVPIGRLKTFIKKSDFFQLGSSDHDTGAVEPVDDDLREIPIHMGAERVPITIHCANLALKLFDGFARREAALPDRGPARLHPIRQCRGRHHFQPQGGDSIELEPFHRLDEPAVPVRSDIEVVVDMTHVVSRRVAGSQIHGLGITEVLGIPNDAAALRFKKLR